MQSDNKFQATGLIKLDTYYDILLNISIVMVMSGGIVFIVSFCGCLGKKLHNCGNFEKLQKLNF